MDVPLAALLINRNLTVESPLRFAGILPDRRSKSIPHKTADHCRWVNPVQTRWKRLFATSSSTAEQLMEIMLPPEYFSSMQSVSMLNSQESNAFIILSSNMALLTRKNFRLIPVRNQTGVSCAPENHQLTVDKWFSSLSLLSQWFQGFSFCLKLQNFSSLPSRRRPKFNILHFCQSYFRCYSMSKIHTGCLPPVQ